MVESVQFFGFFLLHKRLKTRHRIQIRTQISTFVHFQITPIPLLHNINLLFCAFMWSYRFHANTVSNHSVLLGSVSHVKLMVGCLKNSFRVRTEYKSKYSLYCFETSQ